MGLAALQRIDISYVDEHEVLNLLMVAGAGWPHQREALQFVQLIYKLQNIIEYARQVTEQKVVIGLVNAQQPPQSVLEYVQARGVVPTVGIGDDKSVLVKGKPALFPNLPSGEPDIEALQNCNARFFAKQNNLPARPSMEDIHLLEELLEARRHAESEDETIDGDLQILAAAYVGVFLLDVLDGQWIFAPDDQVMDVIHLRVGNRRMIGVNVIAKVGKFLRFGQEDSIAAMLRSLIAMVEERS